MPKDPQKMRVALVKSLSSAPRPRAAPKTAQTLDFIDYRGVCPQVFKLQYAPNLAPRYLAFACPEETLRRARTHAPRAPFRAISRPFAPPSPDLTTSIGNP